MLQLIEVTKRYGQVVANDRISLTVNDGEIVGLLGENGAGKSTLLSIVGGFQQPDSGSISIRGRRVNLDSPRTALRLGISLVHQHFALVPTFTVGEQLALAGRKSGRFPSVLPDGILRDARIEDLALGQRQQVEIARALISRPKVLLLDEPTSLLAPGEIDDLFALLRKIRKSETSIVLVTHKIREALELADRIFVLSGGQLQAMEARVTGRWAEGARARVLNAMFEWRPESAPTKVHHQQQRSEPPSPLLSVEHLRTMPSTDRQALQDITFTLDVGQCLAIVGVDGNGQRELLEALAGYIEYRGEIRLQGADGPEADVPSAIGYLTDDRIGEGGAAEIDLTRNLLLKRQRLPRFARLGMLRWDTIQKSAERAISTWSIEPCDRTRPLGTLSGGNVQKLLLAREFSRLPRLLVAANPAHGLDSRTSEFLWSELSSFAKEGNGVVFTTTDLGDARLHADLVAVLFRGRLSEPTPVASVDERKLGEMMVAGW